MILSSENYEERRANGGTSSVTLLSLFAVLVKEQGQSVRAITLLWARQEIPLSPYLEGGSPP